MDARRSRSIEVMRRDDRAAQYPAVYPRREWLEHRCDDHLVAPMEAGSRAQAGQAEQRHQWERVNEQVLRPLERMAVKLEGVSEAQVAQAAALEHLERWMGRGSGWRD